MSFTQLNSGTYPLHRCVFTEGDEAVYVSNDRNRLGVVYGYKTGTFYNAGIDNPKTCTASLDASSTGATLGRYGIRYRYQNTRTGYVSATSPEVFLNVSASSHRLRLDAVASIDPKVDKIIIEVLPPGNLTWLEAQIVENTTTTYYTAVNPFVGIAIVEYEAEAAHDLPPFFYSAAMVKDRLFGCGSVVESYGEAFGGGDTNVSGNWGGGSTANYGPSGVWLDNTWASGRLFKYDGSGNAVFVSGALKGSVGARLVLEPGTWNTASPETSLGISSFASGDYKIWNISPNLVWYSEAEFPESWDLAEGFINMLRGTDDVVTAVVNFLGNPVVFGSHSCEAWMYEEDPADGTVQPVSKTRGTISQFTVVQHNNLIYSLDRKGVWVFAGGTLPQQVSFVIDEFVEEDIDWTDAWKDFHGCYDPQADEVHFFVRRQGEAEVRQVIRVRTLDGDISFDRYKADIRASTTAPDQNGVLYPLIGTSGGGWFWKNIGQVDGWAEEVSASGYVGRSSTVSQVNVSGWTMPRNLRGIPFAISSPAMSGVIASNTSHSLTPVSSLSGVPATGSVVTLLGIVDMLIETPWMVPPAGPTTEGVYQHLELIHTPVEGDLEISVQFFADWDESTAITLATDVARYNRINQYMTVYAADTTKVWCSIKRGESNGYLRIPIEMAQYQVVKAKIKVETPYNDFALNGWRFASSATSNKVA